MSSFSGLLADHLCNLQPASCFRMTLSLTYPERWQLRRREACSFYYFIAGVEVIACFPGEMFGAAWDPSQTAGLLPCSWFGA
jgi:hypothetical protein